VESGALMGSDDGMDAWMMVRKGMY
jgi:hypothetical protein